LGTFKKEYLSGVSETGRIVGVRANRQERTYKLNYNFCSASNLFNTSASMGVIQKYLPCCVVDSDVHGSETKSYSGGFMSRKIQHQKKHTVANPLLKINVAF
jgi:hypothetical protein